MWLLLNPLSELMASHLSDRKSMLKMTSTLFATPDNNTNPGEEAASSHEPEMDDLRMQEGSTIGNMKNGRLNHGESQLVIGLKENEDEKMTYKENASPTANEEKVTGEGPDESAYGEFTKVNGTAFEGFVSKESYVGEDKQSESLNFSGNASEGGTTEKVLELVGNEFIVESHVVDASIDCQCSEATIPHTAHFAPEYQASGTSDKEMSSSELRLSIDNAVQDEGYFHPSLVAEEENVEFCQRLGLGIPVTARNWFLKVM